MKWNVVHKAVTASTNNDARSGKHGDVFTADFQSAGRGRLDHKWHSAAGENLVMSAVVDVAPLSVAHSATLPLVAGLAVVKTVARLLGSDGAVRLKWPNDVYVNGRKICGILCERAGDNVIVGIGVNVKQRDFPGDISARATSLRLEGLSIGVDDVRDAVLDTLGELYGVWFRGGFASLYEDISRVDMLKSRKVQVVQTDSDTEPVTGISSGIASDGSLCVDGVPVWAGEARVFLAR